MKNSFLCLAMFFVSAGAIATTDCGQIRAVQIDFFGHTMDMITTDGEEVRVVADLSNGSGQDVFGSIIASAMVNKTPICISVISPNLGVSSVTLMD
jgi:hypothetical protein